MNNNIYIHMYTHLTETKYLHKIYNIPNIYTYRIYIPIYIHIAFVAFVYIVVC
jgi:hypothetical protein